MNRETESNLLEFCVHQRDAFSAADWLHFDHPNKDELAAACLFLATQDWYGHDAGLLDVAHQLEAGRKVSLESAVKKTRFDFLRFSNMLRRELHSCTRHTPN